MTATKLSQEIAEYKQAIKSGMSDLYILMCLGDSNILDLAHAELAQEVAIAPVVPVVPVDDPAIRQHELMIAEGFATDPWSVLIAEAEELQAAATQITFTPNPLSIVKVKSYNGYRLVAVGTEFNVKLATKNLAVNPGLVARCRKHGESGTWMMVVEEVLSETGYQEKVAA